MQEMNEKLAFSQRLKQTLSNYDWAKISPTWLAREFNLRYNGKSIKSLLKSKQVFITKTP